MSCCSEYNCRRKDPIMVRPEPFGCGWVAVTLRAALAERDAEIGRLRAAVAEAEEFARDAIAESDRAWRGSGNYEGHELHQMTGAAGLAGSILRALAAPAQAKGGAPRAEWSSSWAQLHGPGGIVETWRGAR